MTDRDSQTPASDTEALDERSRPARAEAAGAGAAAEPPPEIPRAVLTRRICDFDLRIEGGPLEPVIDRFRGELQQRRILKPESVFYFSDDWGVTEGTVSIAIPFYLADAELKLAHQARDGRVEGRDDQEILCYLRHEWGHVLNYAFRLFEREEWTARFGAMSRPYSDDYRSLPLSPDFVRHLPGNYAQKHPDEDWAETFAVWLTPGLDWRSRHSDSPTALGKLEYCDRLLIELVGREPDTLAVVFDEDARDLRKTVEEYYDSVDLANDLAGGTSVSLPRSIDGDLESIFAWASPAAGLATGEGLAAALIRRQQDDLTAAVNRWTGIQPTVLYAILDHLTERAEALRLCYSANRRDAVLVELAGFLTTLAMNSVYTGSLVGR